MKRHTIKWYNTRTTTTQHTNTNKTENTTNMSTTIGLYSKKVEEEINKQIHLQLEVAYAIDAAYCYFARTGVALTHVGKFFKEVAKIEKEIACKYIKYQLLRGGKVNFTNIPAPQTEFVGKDKSDVQYAFEEALKHQKRIENQLRHTFEVATSEKDPETEQFIQQRMQGNVMCMYKFASFIGQLSRIGTDGSGLFEFDRRMKKEEEKTHAVYKQIRG
eukprot:TRINITY_DN3124_c0_g1_i1.p1 TRINITY_DN3124_c0_g1~~TRINITY_DN3124_c0_g1_i1.p1  ORF type:complete len:217 (+),score=50.36 TRINITY_DN3124_c0_g1_i1:312-962(+)